MKIAIVHDDFLQWGGAERLVKALSEIWPEAPIYTSMHAELSGDLVWLKERIVHASFMQRLPLKERFFKFYFWLYPLAFRSLSFKDYDVVFSSSARFAHMIKCPKDTPHISYINSPARMWWYKDTYFSSKILRVLLSPVLSFYRFLDKRYFRRIDTVIANSQNVAQKVRRCFGREVDGVIYPFVDVSKFSCHPLARPEDPDTPAWIPNQVGNDKGGEVLKQVQAFGSESSRVRRDDKKDGFYLVVSRLVPWKKIDIVIEACNQLQLPLTIIGRGEDFPRLKRMAGANVTFLSGLTDREVADYYHRCVALIHPQDEDFGLTPLEAMAAGKPVLAYNKGGVRETVLPGETGEFFNEQTVQSLVELLQSFDPAKYSSEKCQERAKGFSREVFCKSVMQIVKEKN